MAKKTKKRQRRIRWSQAQEKELRAHARNKTPVVKISKAMKRTAGAVRQHAYKLGLSLGHRT